MQINSSQYAFEENSIKINVINKLYDKSDTFYPPNGATLKKSENFSVMGKRVNKI